METPTVDPLESRYHLAAHGQDNLIDLVMPVNGLSHNTG
jgi:hypothetical protein